MIISLSVFGCLKLFEFDPPSKDIVIQEDLLFSIDREETGFRAYRFEDQSR